MVGTELDRHEAEGIDILPYGDLLQLLYEGQIT